MHEVYPKLGDQGWKPGRGQILWQTSQISLMTLMEKRHPQSGMGPESDRKSAFCERSDLVGNSRHRRAVQQRA